MKDSHILVTGGAGFIGSNLVQRLVEQQNKVVVIDNLSTGKLHNIQPFIDDQSIQFIKGDITNYSRVLETIEKYNITHIFHLAAQVSVPLSVERPRDTHEINVNGTVNVLQAAKNQHVQKVVFSSSCAVYGNNNQENAIKENDVTQPLNPYSLSKLIGEQYCSLYSYCFNLPCVSLRYFNVYGPKQDPDGEYAAVIPKFIDRLQSKHAPIIYGNGDQTRDFVYIDDVVNANLLAAEKDIQGIFNIATGKQTSIRELALTIMREMDDFYDPIYMNPRLCEIYHSIANISKASIELSYEITHPLDKGIRKTIEWFNKN